MDNINEAQLLETVKKHKKNYKYSLARKEILSKYSDDFKNIKQPNLLRALAESYYKDLELDKNFSYDIALKILKEIKNDNDEKETLCLKGAVHKRKWEHKANLDDLYKSIEYYKNSYINHKDEDQGYGGINASYLYDVLAQELKDTDEEYSKKLLKKANDLRSDIVNSFKDIEKDEWLYHILAQAYFGNKDFENCKKTLEESTKYEYADWEIFTTFKQMKALATVKNIDNLDCLLPLLDEDCKHILDQSLDKKGLALSGGGFRASFFQLGTLAKLAEYNLLKDIEVISTVSGGTIVGTLYYLKLQILLRDKEDNDIEHKDYTDLVKDLITEFYDVVKTDIRNSVIKSDIGKTFKYLNPFSDYSRTNKLGEIYQERIYEKYQTYLRDLNITPQGFKGTFKPRFNNWRRKNKVPILVINSTNLNSGHNWQFHATKMGEPEYVTDLEIDKNNRFEWVRFKDLENTNQEFYDYTIGQAVACSSAVPMLFTPIVLKDLYKGYNLSISDGGVYDNQGFSGLLSEECDFIICSDASGQMNNQIKSHTSLFRTNLRTIDIQMDRNRELIFEDIQDKNNRGIMKGFLFTHLKHGLKSHVVEHNQTQQKFENEKETVQEKLSKIRTDLDSFSEMEAYALMYNGYELLQNQIEEVSKTNTLINDFTNDYAKIKTEDWVFEKIGISMKNNSRELLDELDLGQEMFFRCMKKCRGKQYE